MSTKSQIGKEAVANITLGTGLSLWLRKHSIVCQISIKPNEVGEYRVFIELLGVIKAKSFLERLSDRGRPVCVETSPMSVSAGLDLLTKQLACGYVKLDCGWLPGQRLENDLGPLFQSVLTELVTGDFSGPKVLRYVGGRWE